jgi:hypothetical protein
MSRRCRPRGRACDTRRCGARSDPENPPIMPNAHVCGGASASALTSCRRVDSFKHVDQTAVCKEKNKKFLKNFRPERMPRVPASVRVIEQSVHRDRRVRKPGLSGASSCVSARARPPRRDHASRSTTLRDRRHVAAIGAVPVPATCPPRKRRTVNPPFFQGFSHISHRKPVGSSTHGDQRSKQHIAMVCAAPRGSHRVASMRP